MPEAYRIEKDSLGEVRVPKSARYGAQTQRAFENFPISGQRFSRRFIQAIGLIKAAAAQTNKELGHLSGRAADAIARAAREVAEGKWDDQFVLDIYQTGSATSTNMNANEVIAHRARELLNGSAIHANDQVNFGQSSNDVIPTAMHVSARVAIEEELIPALQNLDKVLRKKARAFDKVMKSGRTHLMDATPVRLGQEFGGYATQVARSITRLRRASEELSELALGGTAVGTGINTDPRFAAKAITKRGSVLIPVPTDPRFAAKAITKISKATDLKFTEAEDHFEAQGAKDAFVSASGALNATAVALIKIADDIRWMASGPTSGIGEIFLPSVQPGSSIMPGKVNPVMAEALIMTCARTMGNHLTVTVGGSRGNFELNVMMPVMAEAFLESVKLLGNASRAFTTRCVEGIEPNRERARELLEKNPSIATALNPYIGYDKAAEIAKQAAKQGRSVRDVVKEKGLLKGAQLDRALDVRAMTEPGLPD
ncbi:MAG: class II fumarate hydratase [Gemmatimonadetes bacterium]|nr:class II fumarate hydratase [Gemmatimonadota bacterium]